MRTLLLGGCKVEFTWLLTCSIATYHYSFQCFKAMLFRYLQVVVGAGGASMAIESFQYATHSIVSIIGPTMVETKEKIFIIEVFRWLENTISIFIFANTFNKSFDFMLFQLLYKYYVSFKSSKIF